MIYEVHSTQFFDIEDEANDFVHDCRLALLKATVVNPGYPNQQCSTVDLILCRHADHPPEACTLNKHYDNCPVL